MRALLTLFMVAPAAAGGLGFKTATAGSIYGTYTMAVYLLAVPGGFIADRILGARRSVLIGERRSPRVTTLSPCHRSRHFMRGWP